MGIPGKPGTDDINERGEGKPPYKEVMGCGMGLGREVSGLSMGPPIGCKLGMRFLKGLRDAGWGLMGMGDGAEVLH